MSAYGKAIAVGLWYTQIQKLDLRGDENDTAEKLQVWVKSEVRESAAPDEEDHEGARGLFADGILYGMKWAGCFTPPRTPVALAPAPPIEAEAAMFMVAHRNNWDTSEALDDLVQLLHRTRGPRP